MESLSYKKSNYQLVYDSKFNVDTEIKGRKTFAFWSLVGLLFLLAVGNLMLTMTILSVLKLGQGMQSLEIIPEYSSVKLFGNTDFKDVYKRDGRIEGFQDIPIDITGLNGSIAVNIAPKNGRAENKLFMGSNGTTLHSLKEFEVKTDRGKSIFTTTNPTFNIKRPMDNFNAHIVETNRVVSPVDKKLEINTFTNISLKGAEGLSMESSEILLSADQNLYLKSFNGSIIISGAEGTYIDIKKVPIMIPKYNDRPVLQYKVCICMPHGKLFKIPVIDGQTKTYCNHINLSKYNPCM